jgi:hypothetical protein
MKRWYCWICRFEASRIIEVRIYLDLASVHKLLDENEPGVGEQTIGAVRSSRPRLFDFPGWIA